MVGNLPDFMNNPKGKKKLNNIQVLGLGFGILIPLWLLMSGYFTILSGLWMVVLPAILYLLPRIAKVSELKHMVYNGLLFAVIAMLAGGLYLSPVLVDGNSQFHDGGMFKNAEITATGTGYSITVEYTGDDMTYTPVAALVEIELYGYHLLYPRSDGINEFPGTMSGNTVSYDIDAGDKLYILYFFMNDADDKKVSGSQSPSVFLTEKTSSSELNGAIWKGTLYVVSIIVILYFLITLFTYAIRAKANKARDRMIEQGRLYPSGYGRCKECGAIVLPGEINCLKCNAYIDVPKELRPDKADYFECEGCGAEVPEDAEKCPKCGAMFEEIEVEVRRVDGTVEVVHETFSCPRCGLNIPVSAEMCPKCGMSFRK